MKPQRKPQTPETHKAALVSGRRMNAAELAEPRKHPPVDRKPTRKDVANTFKGHKERITEKLNALAYSPDARSLAREYVTFQQVIDHARGHCPDGPALPKMPALIGNDYYAGMIRLADYCTRAADVLDGRKAPTAEGGQAGGVESESTSHEARALALLVEHPDWTDKQIAKHVSCHAKSLYRWPRFVAARQAEKQGRNNLPRGTKYPDGDGSSRVEAWDSDQA